MWGQASGEAEGAGGGGEGADWCREAVVGGVSEGEEEEEEEEDTQQVGGEDGEAVWVLQCRANGRETHVVTEGVTEHWTHQVTCNTRETLTLELTSIQQGTWIKPEPFGTGLVCDFFSVL